MNRCTEYQRDLFTVLETAGITDYRVEEGGKHPRLYFAKDGCEQFYVMPKSPSDRRGTLNAISDLRRMVGRPEREHHGRRERKITQPARGARLPDCLTVPPDPWAALGQLRDRLAWDEAKRAYHYAPHGLRQARYAELRATVNAILRREVGV